MSRPLRIDRARLADVGLRQKSALLRLHSAARNFSTTEFSRGPAYSVRVAMYHGEPRAIRYAAVCRGLVDAGIVYWWRGW